MEKKKESAEPKTIKLGRIWATIWTNHDKKGGVWFNTEIVRRYTDDKGEWQSATQFGLLDLPLVTKVADLAMIWILDQKKSNGREDDESRADD